MHAAEKHIEQLAALWMAAWVLGPRYGPLGVKIAVIVAAAQGPEPIMWYLYLLRCADGSLYTGISTDVEHRIQAHQANHGARRLRGRGPLELVFCSPIGNRSQAQRIEYRVKTLRRVDKERLVKGETQLPQISLQSTSLNPSRNKRSRESNRDES